MLYASVVCFCLGIVCYGFIGKVTLSNVKDFVNGNQHSTSRMIKRMIMLRLFVIAFGFSFIGSLLLSLEVMEGWVYISGTCIVLFIAINLFLIYFSDFVLRIFNKKLYKEHDQKVKEFKLWEKIDDLWLEIRYIVFNNQNAGIDSLSDPVYQEAESEWVKLRLIAITENDWTKEKHIELIRHRNKVTISERLKAEEYEERKLFAPVSSLRFE